MILSSANTELVRSERGKEAHLCLRGQSALFLLQPQPPDQPNLHPRAVVETPKSRGGESRTKLEIRLHRVRLLIVLQRALPCMQQRMTTGRVEGLYFKQ